MHLPRCPFRPPFPEPVSEPRGLLRVLLKPAKLLRSRRCALSPLIDRSYSMHMGEVGLLFRRLYVVNQPELVRRVLIEEAERFPKSTIIADMLELLMGDSIFVSNGEVWKRQRRMMNPAFEQARIKIVFDRMREAVEAFVVRFDAAAEGRPVDIDVEMTHVTADIIFRTIFSKPLEAHEARLIFAALQRFQETAYTHGVSRYIGLPRFMSLLRYRRARRAAAEIRGVLDPLVRVRYDSFHRGEPDHHGDILAALIAVKDPVDGSHFDFRELCEQVSMLFLAGHETSASALSWALYILSRQADVQERLRREAISVFDGRAPRFSDMKRLNLARNVFRETLRLYPPVAFLPRDAAEAVTMRDKKIKPGAIITISPWIIHRHRKLWADPDLFDPDRWDREDSIESQRNAYLPFSLGPRVCLGAAFALQEGTLILALLAREFRFEPVEGHEPKPIGRLTVRSENGIRLKVARRAAAELAS
jgi:cytochrome P450